MVEQVDASVTGVVDDIYESAINPEHWPTALGSMAAMVGSKGGVIFCTTRLDTRPLYRTTPQIAPMARIFVESGGMEQSFRAKLPFISPFPEFAPTRNAATGNDLEDDITTKMLARVGLGEESTTHIRMPTGEMVTIGVQGALGEPVHNAEQLAQLNGLLPHLSRSTMIAAQLRMEMARSAVNMLGMMSIPAAVVSLAGRVMATNTWFENLPSLFLTRAFDGLSVADPTAERLFREALRGISWDTTLAGRSIPVARTEKRAPAVLHLLPLRRTARDILSGGDVLLAVSMPGAGKTEVSPNLLAALFDLSPTQARTAAALASDAPIAGIARSMGVTEKTIRTYIERILVKTGSRKLSDLRVLLNQFRSD
jgi:DNA-binding CsgD family transcriptional regulator